MNRSFDLETAQGWPWPKSRYQPCQCWEAGQVLDDCVLFRLGYAPGMLEVVLGRWKALMVRRRRIGRN